VGPHRRTLGVATLTATAAAPIWHGRAALASARSTAPTVEPVKCARSPSSCRAVGSRRLLRRRGDRRLARHRVLNRRLWYRAARGRVPWQPFRVRHGIQVAHPPPGKSRRPTATRERLRCFHGRLRRGYSRFDHGHDRPQVGGSVASASVMTVAKSGVDDLRVNRDHSRSEDSRSDTTRSPTG
jgi:hypothetical protein